MAEGCVRGSRVSELDDFPLPLSRRQISQRPIRHENRPIICQYFRQGRCRYGSRCWNIHSTMSQSVLAKNLAQSERNAAGTSRPAARNRESTCSARIDRSKSDSSERNFNPVNRNQHRRADQRSSSSVPSATNWANAPEFVPHQSKSYAETLKSSIKRSNAARTDKSKVDLCPHYISGICPYSEASEECPFVHGKVCSMCCKAAIHPYNEQQKQEHIADCEKELKQEMELSFAIHRSLDKTCGICMDVILEKEPISDRRFGILEKCNHVFCLACIRKWRRVKSFDTHNYLDNAEPEVTKSCPECRIPSDFITPSNYWIDTPDQKTELIAKYKVHLSTKHCKYFRRGKGTCPFGGACFYLHAKPDGTKVQLPQPTRRRRQSNDGELDFMGRIVLWDYLELRADNILMQLDLDDFLYDSDEDELSDNSDIFLSNSVYRHSMF